MELRNFIRVLQRGWLLIVALLVVGGAVGVGLTVVTTPMYKSTAKIFVSSNASADGNGLGGGSTFTQDRTAAYLIFAKAPAVTGAVVDELDLTLTGQEVGRKLSAAVESNKVVIDLSAVDGDPTRAAAIVNSAAKFFIAEVDENEQKQTITAADGTVTTQSVVKLGVVYQGNVPTTPVSPRPVLNLALGLVVGLLLGLGVVILRDVLDNTMKSQQDFEALGMPVLGTVPFDRRTVRSPVAFRADPHSARSEAYRAMRTNLQFVDIDNPPHVIVVTSAMPSEGKTTTSINLASALAEAGYRVCLIDADLRRPSVADTLGLVGSVGFTSVLISETPVEDVLQNAGRNLAVLSSGPVPPNPSELLISEHARAVIADIAAKVDYCIIDSPPLLPVTDSAELATIADATVLVARAGKTTTDQSKRAIEALAKVGEKPVGVILNMVSAGSAADYSYGSYYGPYRPRSKPKASEIAAADVEGVTPDEDGDATAPAEDEAVVVADAADVEREDADAATTVVDDADPSDASAAATEDATDDEDVRDGVALR